MSYKKLALAAIVALGMVSSVQAEDEVVPPAGNAAQNQGSGTIKFHGFVNTGACSITPETQNQTVELGSIAKHVLDNGEMKSTPKPFSIKLENCDTSNLQDKTVSTTFTGDTIQDDILAVTGDVTGAGVALGLENGTPIKLNEAIVNPIMDGSNELHFSAYLQGLGEQGGVTPGEFNSSAQFTLAYQ
ncbi:type 1 fimbrial protein [Citrobacter portucalensis]|uniref:Type 1 fimbrial protein n=1 Tax=Citrobacter portucalensis TaxID=1639133 RepID=A0AAW5W7X9_9ENTR|nr:fimbrial protein [Citrobacter portucalensis]MCX9004740.1 type 1 fimbrial protein [Citrobacter portucalensis]